MLATKKSQPAVFTDNARAGHALCLSDTHICATMLVTGEEHAGTNHCVAGVIGMNNSARVRRLRFTLPLAVFVAATCCAPLIHAAAITWGPATNVSTALDAALDVMTDGILVEAFNAANTNSGAVTVNGVQFSNTNTLLPLSSGQDFFFGSTGDLNYDQLLSTLDFGGGTSTSIDIGNGNLIAGFTYSLQVWFTDNRTVTTRSRVMTYGDGLGNTVNLAASISTQAGVPGPGQFAIGTFIADGTTQTLSMATNGFANAHINAYQVRQQQQPVPEPATIALIGAALFGLAFSRQRARTRA